MLKWRSIIPPPAPSACTRKCICIPAASHVMNFVVLSAALSSALCNLYFTARLLFSLSRSGCAPVFLGKLSKKGMPVAAVLASSVGLAVALGLSQVFKEPAFVVLIGAGFFGGPFIWLITLAPHLAFHFRVTQ